MIEWRCGRIQTAGRGRGRDTVLIPVAMLALAMVSEPAFASRAVQARISYDRDVQPILSENCFACHGMDTGKRMAGLLLGRTEGAHGRLATGHAALVPGKP